MDYKEIKYKLESMKFIGINEYLFIDFYGDHLSISALKIRGNVNLTDNDSFEKKISLIASSIFNYKNDIFNVYTEIKSFIEKNNLINYYIISGVSEFRVLTEKLPIEIDNIEEYISENVAKYLPSGRSKEEFIIKQWVYNSDNDYYNILIFISRRNYIDEITSFIDKLNIKYLAITPLIPNIEYLTKTENALASIYIQDGRILLFLKLNNELVYDELYYNSNVEQLSSALENRLKVNSQKQEKEKQIIIVSSSNNLEEHNATIIYKLLSNYKLIPSINNSIFVKYAENINLTLRGINNYNFLNNERLKRTKEEIEEGFIRRYFQFAAVAIICLLTLLYIGEVFIGSKILASDSEVSEIIIKEELCKKISDENLKKEQYLKKLLEIKNTSKLSGDILKDISLAINKNTVLNSVEIIDRDNKVEIRIFGQCLYQSDISENLSNFENIEGFNNTVLVYSKISKKGKNKKRNLEFSISAEYD